MFDDTGVVVFDVVDVVREGLGVFLIIFGVLDIVLVDTLVLYDGEVDGRDVSSDFTLTTGEGGSILVLLLGSAESDDDKRVTCIVCGLLDSMRLSSFDDV